MQRSGPCNRNLWGLGISHPEIPSALPVTTEDSPSEHPPHLSPPQVARQPPTMQFKEHPPLFTVSLNTLVSGEPESIQNGIRGAKDFRHVWPD